MRTAIYYFSSTGNCYTIARQISEKLENCEIHSVNHLSNEDKVIPKADAVGFIFPMFFGSIPPIVKAFIGKTDLNSTEYLFGINTAGMSPGNTLHELDSLLKSKGNKLHAGFFIRMPCNYILGWYYNLIKGNNETKNNLIHNAVKQTDKIISLIKDRAKNRLPVNKVFSIVPKLINPGILFTKVNTWDRNFSADDKCIACGSCVKICPVKNIELKNDRPAWNHNCILCLSCLHRCPRSAVQFRNITNNRDRYHHPDVKLEELHKLL